MRVVHVVVSDAFAGVERHIATLAAWQGTNGYDVTVIGGASDEMRQALDPAGVRYRPARNLAQAASALAAGRWDITHVHMTSAEVIAAAQLRGGPLVSTRHFASRRGSSPIGRLAGAAAARRLSAQIAISQYVADHIEGPAQVIHPGVPARSVRRVRSTTGPGTVLVVQRLEAEKDTALAIAAFGSAGLADLGWRLRIAGDGSQRTQLEQLAYGLGVRDDVDFLGHRRDVPDLMDSSSILLAPCPVEGFGLTVVEAMAAGLPVVATAAGGHLETVGPCPDSALFPVGDVEAAADLLRALANDPARRDDYGAALQAGQASRLTTQRQGQATDAVYRSLR